MERMAHALVLSATRVSMEGHRHWGRGLFALAVLAVIIGLIVWAVVRLTSHRQPATAGPSASPGRMPAEEVLADRLARGEIDTEEYRQRLSALRGG